jgi:hypothetical protein
MFFHGQQLGVEAVNLAPVDHNLIFHNVMLRAKSLCELNTIAFFLLRCAELIYDLAYLAFQAGDTLAQAPAFTPTSAQLLPKGILVIDVQSQTLAALVQLAPALRCTA